MAKSGMKPISIYQSIFDLMNFLQWLLINMDKVTNELFKGG